MIRLGGLACSITDLPSSSTRSPTRPARSVKLQFANMAATANGFRHSGASALVSRFIRRRAGPVG